jgi:hypothetical protein
MLVTIRIWCDAVCPSWWSPTYRGNMTPSKVRIQWSRDTAFFQHSGIISALLVVTNITKITRTWQQNVPLLATAHLQQGCCAAEVKLPVVQHYIITAVLLTDPRCKLSSIFLPSSQRRMRDQYQHTRQNYLWIILPFCLSASHQLIRRLSDPEASHHVTAILTKH